MIITKTDTFSHNRRFKNFYDICSNISDDIEVLSLILTINNLITYESVIVCTPSLIKFQISNIVRLIFREDYYFLEIFNNRRTYILLTPDTRVLTFFDRRVYYMCLYHEWMREFKKSLNTSCKEHFNNFNYVRAKNGLKQLTLEEILAYD
jgi:hypothetical protein